MKNKKIFFGSLAAILAGLVLIVLNGCKEAKPADAQKIGQIIKMGSSTGMAIGLVAIKNPEDAIKTAQITSDAITNSVLPLLNGSEEGLVQGLDQLLNLSVFDKVEGMQKAKLIIKSILPVLTVYLPDDAVDKVNNKIRPDVKIYLKSFFEGVKVGCDDYLASMNGTPKGGTDYKALREQLSK